VGHSHSRDLSGFGKVKRNWISLRRSVAVLRVGNSDVVVASSVRDVVPSTVDSVANGQWESFIKESSSAKLSSNSLSGDDDAKRGANEYDESILHFDRVNRMKQ